MTGRWPARPAPPEADVLVPFFNKHEVLLRCLRALLAAIGRRHHVVLIDDGSRPWERHAVDEFVARAGRPIEVVTLPENRGYKEALCAGFRAGRRPYVLFLNSDAVVTPGFDLRLLEAMADPLVGAAAPVSNHPTDLFQYRPALAGLRPEAAVDPGADLDRRFRRLRPVPAGTITAAPYLTGMCLALERGLFERVGLFGLAYRHGYFEDLALSCQLRQLGYRLVVREDCFVYHQGHATYTEKTQDEKSDIVFHNFRIFEAEWGHMPEHADLRQRMDYAGEVAPL
ncbi:MAG TPA: glycosyltransferase [Thermoanaerobaculia bacterium]|nr:glycosyltransferase [Thermoanaerobaculia bacterium]